MGIFVILFGLLTVISSAEPVNAGAFYVPSSTDRSLLQRIEAKVQRITDDALLIVQAKVGDLTDSFLTAPRGLYLLNTVANILRLEIERRMLIASQAWLESDDVHEENTPITLTISDEQAKLLKRMEGYRFNRE